MPKKNWILSEDNPFSIIILFGIIILLPFIQVYFAIRRFLSDG